MIIDIEKAEEQEFPKKLISEVEEIFIREGGEIITENEISDLRERREVHEHNLTSQAISKELGSGIEIKKIATSLGKTASLKLNTLTATLIEKLGETCTDDTFESDGTPGKIDVKTKKSDEVKRNFVLMITFEESTPVSLELEESTNEAESVFNFVYFDLYEITEK